MTIETHRLTYRLAWHLTRGFYNILYRLDVRGERNIPREGGFILAANHASYLDPPAFGCAVPREIAYFARKTLFKPGPVDKLLRALNSIPVDRDGDSDIAAFKQVFATLRAGRGILLFPEGTRTLDGHLQPPKKGVGLIACKARVPVVPARIFGSFEAYPKGAPLPQLYPPLSVAFGTPLMPETYDPGKNDLQRYDVASQRIMDAIAQLKP